MKTELASLYTIVTAVAAGHAKNLTREGFALQAGKFVNSELAPETFRAICDAALENNRVRENKLFEAEVYAFRAVTHWLNGDTGQARIDARNALSRDAYCILALQVLYTVYMAMGKLGRAAAVLEKLATITLSHGARKRLLSIAKDLTFRAGAVECETLLRHFLHNEAEANTKYAGRIIAVTGVVAEMTRSSLGRPKAILAGTTNSPAVSALFNPDANDGYASLAEGDLLMLSGYCSGLINGFIGLKECRVISDP